MMSDEDIFDRVDARSEIIDRARRAYLEMMDLLEGLSEEELSRPRSGGWAVKDHLSHLAAWEQGISALLQRQSRYEAMGLPANVDGYTEDEVNDMIYQQRAALTGAEAREQLRAAHEEILAVLENLRDEDVHAPYVAFLPEGADATQLPVRLAIINNTFGHYEEHIGWIRDMLTR
jgi:hypothetical protein